MLEEKMKHLPKRIILVRHGECEVNEDERVLEYVPNHKIKLIERGVAQAKMAASKIREIVSENANWKIFFYVSPWNRTRATMEEMIGRGETFTTDKIVGIREDCRLREQHSGNFQNVEEMRKMKRERNSYGKFFYRVPHGESAADVYDRVSSFVEELWREMESNKSEELNLIVVSHGLIILLLLMKLFNWTVDEFEGLINPPNCEYRVLQLGAGGKYNLAHHHIDELKQWGLSDQMIKDQIIRARGFQPFLDQPED
ncbi:Phosphoglycerate mutase family protein, partial [Perilla frutescens var. hirtella]